MLLMRLQRLNWVYKDYPIYYLTLTSHDRKWLFANREVRQAFVIFSEKAINHGVAVGRYVLLPDHIHLFAAFAPNSIDLSAWIKSLKNSISKCLRQRGIPSPHWQKGFFDHVLRSEESYKEKWEYVRLNPVRADLVDKADDWEFQGVICQLETPVEE